MHFYSLVCYGHTYYAEWQLEFYLVTRKKNMFLQFVPVMIFVKF